MNETNYFGFMKTANQTEPKQGPFEASFFEDLEFLRMALKANLNYYKEDGYIGYSIYSYVDFFDKNTWNLIETFAPAA
jgi:hypothetical protein